MLLAIDPGNEESALLLYDTVTSTPVQWAKLPNAEALRWIDQRLGKGLFPTADELAIEMVASYGMAVGASIFATCVWSGRFLERWALHSGERPAHCVYRSEVKTHLCHSMRAKDANIRQALLDRWGGKEQAVGRKASPGPLYGIAGDCWSALAVAVTVAERTPVLIEQLPLAS